MQKKIYIISNDKIYKNKKGQLYTSNNDLNNILNALNNRLNVYLIARKTNVKNIHKISNVKIQDYKNIGHNARVLMVSITPYNFFIFLYLILFRRLNIRGNLYLRSDGFLEYKYRFGWIGYYIYYLMFFLIKKKLRLISCSNSFVNVDTNHLVYPSEIDKDWLSDIKKPSLDKIRFLYVGRFTYDKGGFFIQKLYNLKKSFFHFNVVGFNESILKKKFIFKSRDSFKHNFIFQDQVSKKSELINIFDKSNILLLPSYIEGFPKVICESLARLRPVIIFEEINYVINNRQGIFVCKRDINELFKLSRYILKNYTKIQKKILLNKKYTKKSFQKSLLNLVLN